MTSEGEFFQVAEGVIASARELHEQGDEESAKAAMEELFGAWLEREATIDHLVSKYDAPVTGQEG